MMISDKTEIEFWVLKSYEHKYLQWILDNDSGSRLTYKIELRDQNRKHRKKDILNRIDPTLNENIWSFVCNVNNIMYTYSRRN